MSISRNANRPWTPSKRADVVLYLAAAVSYIGLSIYNKWLLDWIVGPLWLVAWVWGVPALVRFIRRQPIRPQRGPDWKPGNVGADWKPRGDE